MNSGVIVALLCLSFSFIAVAVIMTIIRLIGSASKVKGPSDGIRGIGWYLIFVVISVWILRYAVGYYAYFFPTDEMKSVSLAEGIFNSLIHTFQTFSLDEDYTSYINIGKEMMGKITDGNAFWVGTYGIYASVLNTLAPICGGVAILSIIQAVFPVVKLFFAEAAFWKEKHYFSELNDRSYALAKSILNRHIDNPWKNEKNRHNNAVKWLLKIFARPVIIFTDVYAGKSDEVSYELILNAKAMGAICISYDLTMLSHEHIKRKNYWLMDENEIDNIQTLAKLSPVASSSKNSDDQSSNNVNQHRKKVLEDTKIYAFYQDEAYLLAGSVIWNEEEIKKQYDDKTAPPKMSRIKQYQLLIFDLLFELPLYLPLKDREQVDGLNVSILGNGYIGTEMLLSTYWCGQMLDIPLSINLVSNDSEKVACGKLDLINTDILDSVRKDSEILNVFEGKSEKNPSYFTFRYCEADLSNQNIEDINNIFCKIPERVKVKQKEDQKSEVNEKQDLLSSDYYLVALGSDEANIKAAEMLCRAIARKQLNENGKNEKVIIAYVVYNSELCDALGEKPFMEESTNIIMKAIGSRDKIYDINNISNISGVLEKRRKNMKKDYDSLSGKNVDQTSENTYNEVKVYDYNYWSSLAQAIHYKYKLFSAYLYEKTNRSYEENWEKFEEKRTEYICQSKDDELAKRLAWLEHRRWNAYLRSLGYKKGNAKNLKAKLHKLLVESKDPGGEPTGVDLLDKAGGDKNYDYIGICPINNIKQNDQQTEKNIQEENKNVST